MGLFDKLFGRKETKQPIVEIKKEPPKPKAPPKPACEHGKCYIFEDKLCCNCDDAISCDKKVKFGSDKRLEPELVDFYKAYDEYLKMKNKITESAQKKAEAAGGHFIRAYQPKLAFAKAHVFGYIAKYGLDNERTRFVKNMQKVDLPSDYKQKLEFVWNKYLNQELDISSEWLCKTSLYKRSYREFQYTVNALTTFSNEERIAYYLKDSSVVEFNEFYDENGEIKPAGIDGCDGDTIYNMIEIWAANNEYTPEEIAERNGY